MSVADQEHQAEERRREALKVQFDHLKHLTTLGGATALVELSIYESVKVPSGVLAVSLVALALCVGGSLWSMAESSVKMQSSESAGSAEASFSRIYLAGLALFALSAAGLPFAVALAMTFLACLGVVIVSQVMIWRIRRRL